MWSKIDDTIQFEQTSFNADTWSRDCDDRSVVGLNGVVSVDMGLRTRRIVQKGLLRSISKDTLSGIISNIAELIDGSEHTVNLEDGRSFEHLRIESVDFDQPQTSGTGAACSFKITYTQLRE